MKKFLGILGALALLASPALAADNIAINNALGTVDILCAVDNSGVKTLCVGSGSGATANQIQGNVAGAAADSGNPVKVGCKYNVVEPTYVDGNRGDCQSDARGNLRIVPMVGGSATAVSGVLALADGTANASAAAFSNNFPMLFNGTTWDRSFTCPTTAVVNVTAGATTELVPLTASQIIRVCAFAITMSAAGTAKFISGTGTNCGTGAADITGAMTLGTTTPMTLSASTGSILRSPVANALCLTAATGNVTGFVTYVKY